MAAYEVTLADDTIKWVKAPSAFVVRKAYPDARRVDPLDFRPALEEIDEVLP